MRRRHESAARTKRQARASVLCVPPLAAPLRGPLPHPQPLVSHPHVTTPMLIGTAAALGGPPAARRDREVLLQRQPAAAAVVGGGESTWGGDGGDPKLSLFLAGGGAGTVRYCCDRSHSQAVQAFKPKAAAGSCHHHTTSVSSPSR